jgi:hypothetical protein
VSGILHAQLLPPLCRLRTRSHWLAVRHTPSLRLLIAVLRGDHGVDPTARSLVQHIRLQSFHRRYRKSPFSFAAAPTECSWTMIQCSSRSFRPSEHPRVRAVRSSSKCWLCGTIAGAGDVLGLASR